ncbi:SpoIID/LytB domain-containing protein [Priestia megaterium]|uniref:SpoIID/LytB domain-containing protein n=1 Tax=Priestia megaterium TaxID=1404 RepID=UPI002E1D0B2A|nr:SpoIID/LytB domain-containing protein [Priestia megaterium]MED4285580.1 SpoIID/LytB domain-containing protein [Priestia megaterium]
MRKSTTYAISMALSISLLAPYAATVKASSYTDPLYGSPISVRLGYSAFQKPSYSFTISGTYSAKEKNDITLTNGTYTVRNNASKIEILKDTDVLYSGSQITLFPVDYDREHTILLGSYKFLGNMTFRPSGSNVLPVNTLEQEDYLLGVVSSEMSDGWGSTGIEALKAQAITARTYSNGDIGDEIDNGQSYQVYNGYNENYANVQNAVDSTRKQVITYNGSSINTNAVFSSSNGGTMLSKVNSWGTASWNDIPYLVRNTDPYDLRSATTNTNWQFTLDKSQISLSGLDLMKPEVWWNGVQEKTADSSKIAGLKNFIKKYQTEYKNYDLKVLSIDELKFTDHNDLISNDTQLNGTVKISYIAYNPTTNTYVKNTDGTIKVLTFSKSTRTYDYYLSGAFGSGVLKSPNIKSSSSTSTQYVITGGGWGHGIGLSQWGAYQRAKEGQKAADIIAFYYPGTKLTSAQPTSNREEAVYATANEPINLRSSASWSGSVITVIQTGETVEVLDGSNDWYKVSYKSKEGYVNKDYVTTKENTPETTAPTVDPEVTLLSTTNDQSTFYGEYSIAQKSDVSVRLTGPNGYNKLTFLATLDAGKYSFGGPINQAPAGNYTVTITVTSNGKSVVKTANFIKKSAPTVTIPSVSATDTTFSGQLNVDQKSKVSVYLSGPNVQKFIYYNDALVGNQPFGGYIPTNFANGLYQIKIVAENENGTTTTTKEFNINRGIPTQIALKSFTFTNGTYYGTYQIDQESLVAITLKGPNGLQRLTYYQTIQPGTYAYAGNISSFPKGNYSVVITAKNKQNINSSTVTNFNFGQVATKTYTVKSGDTLYAVSRKVNVSVNSLMGLNSLKSTSLRVGQVLKVTP